MSPAFVDSAPPPSSSNGQIFSPLINPSRIASPGFSDRMDPSFGFTSKPAAGVSRAPRLAKLRKPLTGHRPSLTRPVSQSGVEPGVGDSGFDSSRVNSGFASAKPPSELNVDRGFMFGSNDGGRTNFSGVSSSNLFSESVVDNNLETGAVTDRLRRLKSESEKVSSDSMNVKIGGGGGSRSGTSGISSNPNLISKGFTVQSVDSELQFEMSRLHIDREHFRQSYGGNMEDLPAKIKDLNLKDSRNFGVGKSVDESLDGRTDSVLHNKMKNLNIKDTLGTSRNEKVYDVRAGDNANKQADLNTTNVAGSSTCYLRTEPRLHFGAETMNDMEGMGDGNLRNIPGSWNSGFTFQAGLDNNNRGVQGSLKNESNLRSSQMFASGGIHLKPVGGVPEVPSVNLDNKKVEFSFTSKLDSVVPGYVEFKTPDPTVDKLFGLNRRVDTKRESAKDSGLNKKKGKWKKSNQVPFKFQQESVFQASLQDDTEFSEQYSPMDLSPYEETLANDTFSRETSVASEESSHFDENSGGYPNVPNESIDEVLISATEGLYINEYGVKGHEGEDEESTYCVDNDIRVESPEEDTVSGAETESFKSAADELEYSTDSFVTAAETEVSSCSKIDRQDNDGETCSTYDTSLTDRVQGSFNFAASSSSLSEFSASTRIRKKKNRIKLGHDSYDPTPSVDAFHASSHLPPFQFSGISLSSPEQGSKGHSTSTLLSPKMDKTEPVKELGSKQVSATAVRIAVQESCEKWRLRGNQAYAKADFFRAEDCYTEGINCISQNETSRSCLRALMLCYSNRAATRMSLGRLREALGDCFRASSIDPNFLRVQVRAASCYLSLGELENATLYFMKCLQAGVEVCADRKLLVEASEGLENTKKVADCMKQAGELLGRKTSSDIECAVGVISEGLRISSYSEKLLQMKADALLMLKKYEELIQFCEQIHGFVESNFLLSDVNSLSVDSCGFDLKRAPSFKVWCWSLILKSYFYLGKLEEALAFLKKQEEPVLLVECERKTLESMIPLIGTIRELLKHKAAGNESYKSGKYAEAVEHYTAAISCSVESRPFAAICFCNRAAAHRAMGQIVDAIADCSLAIALDGNYHKAISRRAALYEMIRDYEQAASDLQKLASLLTKEVNKKTDQSGTSDKVDYLNELRQARLKLSEMEETARNEIPLNAYLILGVDPSAAASEIKKAYRKAALKYHPDKAGQIFVRTENTDDSMWREIAEEVHKDADKLFKMIGEAYTILSDPTKRSQYNLEEEMRNTPHRGHSSNFSKVYSDFHNAYERSSNRRHWQDFWRSSGPSNRFSERNPDNWYS